MGRSVHQLAPSAGARAEVFAAICRRLQAELGEPVSPRWALQKLCQLQLLAPAQCRELAALLGDCAEVGVWGMCGDWTGTGLSPAP